MQIDNNFGIIPDTQAQILQNYLTNIVNVFPNATTPDSPAYVIADTCSFFDSLIQESLQVMWNSKNSNTASGLGLDILANTVLNLTRLSAVPSNAVISVVINNIKSFVDVTINVTVGAPVLLPVSWSVTGVGIIPVYALETAFNIPSSGVYVVRLYSSNTTIPVLINTLDMPTAVVGVTFNDVTNESPAILGTCTIPLNWQVTSSILSPTPTYTTNQQYVFTANGTYQIIVYSNDITTDVQVGQLNVAPAINNVETPPVNMIVSVTNPAPNVLGKPVESDEKFSARRRYYLNVEGQTYYGMEKSIINIGAPALNSVFIQEVIEDIAVQSILIVKITVVVVGPPVTIPVGFQMVLSTNPLPSAPYMTTQAYSFNASGDYYIITQSTDQNINIAIGDVTGATTVITGVTVVSNLDPAIHYPGYALGSRGYRVFLGYPQNGPGGVGFDTQDVFLQLIASACFQFHPLGTQFYSGNAGATNFAVNTPYSGYISNVILNPLQLTQASVTLTIVYNTNPLDIGSSNGLFNLALLSSGDLFDQLVDLINEYFRSKTLPTDLTFSVSELSDLITDAYSGIVSLGTSTVPFTMGTISPPLIGRVFLRKPIGFVFNLLPENFAFTAINKESA